MEQNQPIDNQVLDQATNDDLQKAIDDITNTTNVDPVFSDPVAAPSSVPEGDTGELSEPVGPFPEPEVEIPPAPAPEPIAPIEPVDLPNLGAPTPAPMPEEIAIESMPEPTQEPETPVVDSTPTIEALSVETIPQSLSTTEVKKAALRDLVPLLNKIDMDHAQRFKVYRDIFDELKDYTVLQPAYQAAREIPDEKERAEALLYLVESINKM
ncbi:MAG: hypothetical protein K6G49_01205 [Candidatus Saccharibacteria bacterium]|nr:hypothetical protein [Candidatus Saccharibacteria bacterium]